MNEKFKFPFPASSAFSTRVAYFCMEFAIHQPLKIYAGGLGYLAGSHMRSAFELKQHMVGIGILWKFGYYDQVRKSDQRMDVLFEEKNYGFLKKTDIKFTIPVNGHNVWVTAWYLPPEVFKTAPVFLLSTDLPENDYLSQTISHRLYDPNPETRIAASILLGLGGARLLEHLDWEPEVYHLNESHALPLAFYLYGRFKTVGEVKKHLVFTNHTPEDGGNMKTNFSLLSKMGFFCEIQLTEARSIAYMHGDLLDHTLTALRLAGIANAVSRLHKQTMEKIWSNQDGFCPLVSITNAQNYRYWADTAMYDAVRANDDQKLISLKAAAKDELFELVADQNGEIYDNKILTLVFAKRFAGYKRPDLLLNNRERFEQLANNKDRPIQIIWAGKPHPMDFAAIGVFDNIVNICKTFPNCSVLAGYEMKLSKILKHGADVWLNTPRYTHEASGTSGMTAAMNGALNLSIPDGWFPEFAIDKHNSFVIPACDPNWPEYQQDETDANHLYELLEKEIIPMYYDSPTRWLSIVKNSMQEILPNFDSNRMAREYYEIVYDRVRTN
jgi:glycogen phosphorylase